MNDRPAPAGFAPEDLFLERRITDLDLSPDGACAVVALKSVDRDEDRYRSQLWLVPLDGDGPRQLTATESEDRSPRWSPDGRTIAFLSDRGGGPAQLHLIARDGGEARPLTRLRCPVLDFAWRPDGRQLAAVCGVHVDPDRRGEDTHAPDLQRPARDAHEPEVAWRLPYKSDGSGYTLASRLQLALVDAGSGEASVVAAGDFDVGGIAWSPDGAQIAFSRSREAPRETHCTDLWVLPLDARGACGPARSWRCQVATAASPAWSPDGARVAFVGATNGGDAIMRLWLRDVAAGRVQAVGGDDLEVAPGPLQWSADGRRIAFVQAWRGVQRVAAVDVETGAVEPLVEPAHGQVGSLAARGRIAYTEEGADHPIELHASDWSGAAPRRLTDFNAWFRERRALRAERRAFEVPDGRGGTERVEGWLLRPPEARGPLPLLVDVHGGPASYVSLQYATTPYWQVLASRGWAVLMLDAVGSSSYGRAFAERLNAHWGELDLPQHLAAVAALRREGLADARTAVSGASYGGYLASRAIGHCDEFRAAVIIAPVANLESHFGTSDSGYYADPYSMEGKPEANRELMLRLSPMARIESACAPALLIQGKDDQRCPVGQSEELFVKLLRSGTPAELLLYPGGSHHVLSQGRPSHRLHAVRRIVDWLERWIDQPREPRR